MRSPLVLGAPLAGWSTDLEEAPDAVFAGRLLGDGVAIDPTSDTLLAPCAGEVVQLAATHHALTLRAGGCDILLHVGIDTVALRGEGFTPRVALGAHVRAGEPLLSFDLDALARRAKSVLTPIIITAESPVRIAQRTLGRAVRPLEPLLELQRGDTPGASTAAPDGAPRARRALEVTLEHGIHARPAAQLAAALRPLAADVRVHAGERSANARSPVALMALGITRGARVEVSASGPDAEAALELLAQALTAREPRAAPPPAPPPAVLPTRTLTAGAFAGVIASPGLGVGPLVPLRREEIPVAESGAGVAAETTALERARASVRVRLERAATDGAADAAARQIAAAHLELLEDPELLVAARQLIGSGRSAGFAWRAVLRAQAQQLAALADPRQRERAEDLLDLETQVLQVLSGAPATAAPALPEGAIVLARELLPSQLLALDPARMAGIAMAGGGATSHASILAAAMGIPTLVALGPEVLRASAGAEAVLDAWQGVLETRPPPQRLAEVRGLVEGQRVRRDTVRQAAQAQGRTADGTRILVFANVGSVAEARAAVANGAEGCGLLRTEFLFMDRREAPDEAEQGAAYAAIAAAMPGRPITLRTLDAGGDKPLAYLPLPPEDNPALGLRGVRTSLAYPQLLRAQLRAVLGVRGADLRVLLPMITDLEELRRVRALLEELRAAEPGAPAVQVGVMIETPAAALLAEALAAEADFLSIGTNDLTQYTLAMDRGHTLLAPRIDALHPAVLALIARTAQGAHAHRRHAAVCGGLASEPAAAALLVGLGIDELSAVPAAVPEVKARLHGVRLEECRGLAARALKCTDTAAVRTLLGLAVAAGSGD
ncbi:MAG: phosphoenolpyruvate--protein phosphotransferase [Gammaproteobacteria bacterium]|nr:phosphoenolpyruvate--protein phosphotransferase [Gammaproteobacteria bacterium]